MTRHFTKTRSFLAGLCLIAAGVYSGPSLAAELHYRWQTVDGINIFYREGGSSDAPTIVFLHGYPSSSIMYEKVMERLLDARALHVIAMDYPSFGYSDAPDSKKYVYTFDHIALTVQHFLQARGITRYALYMQDYGVPVGFRLIAADPSAVTAIMVQNGVIHLDGFPAAQDPTSELRQHWLHRNPAVDSKRAAYANSLSFPSPQRWDESDHMSPDAILLMVASVKRPGVVEARNSLWADYGSNVAHYPQWQALLKTLKVPVLVIWGSRDDFFTVPGAVAYLRDAPQAEVHVLDTVHFATLESPDAVGQILVDFTGRHDLH
jgi:pimeloyl-ACP methyl ester carboxylesterase